MNWTEAATALVNDMRSAIAGAAEPAPAPTRRRPAPANPGHHPEMHDAPHDTEVVRHSRALGPGRQRYRLQYAGKLKTPLPNLSDTRVFWYAVNPAGSSMYAIAEGGFYATANGNRVPVGRHWWSVGTGCVMIGQVAETLARARAARGQPAARSALARVSNPAPANPAPAMRSTPAPANPAPSYPRTHAQICADRSAVFYNRARFYARGTTEARRREAGRAYLNAVDNALQGGIAVPRPPAGLDTRHIELAAISIPDSRSPEHLLREAQRAIQSVQTPPQPMPRTDGGYHDVGANAPNPRQTALGAGAARAVQSSRLPPADAPDAASFGLGPLAAAKDESEREKLIGCAICMDEEKPRVALFAPCGHLAACLSCYHAACAADARNARTCPICKAEGKPVLMRLA